MNISKLLSDLKGKVLDVKHLELLNHAYEIQEKNICQLKTNNSAISDNNNLLKEKIKFLENEIKKLALENKELLAKTLEQDDAEEKIILSDSAVKVLQKIIDEDVTEFYQNAMIKSINMGRIETQAALDELSDKELIDASSARCGYGLHYYLTRKAKKAIASMK